MVRVFIICLLSLLLHAASVKEKVREIVGEQKFNQSRLIINTVFANEKRFKNGSSIDLYKILYTLKRLGFLQSSFAKAQNQSIELYSYLANPLVYKLFLRSLQEAELFGYRIERIVQDEEGVYLRILFRSTLAADPVKITKFLQTHGAKVLSIVRDGYNWRYYVDFSRASFPALRCNKELHISYVRRALWIVSGGNTALLLKSHPRNHWHPAVYIYDRYLYPVETIKRSKHVKSLRIKLPKGFYYIKIADTFTLENLKYGIDIYAKQD